MEEIRNQKVVSSNPGAIYWMDIFYIDLLQNCDVWLKSTKINIKSELSKHFGINSVANLINILCS